MLVGCDGLVALHKLFSDQCMEDTMLVPLSPRSVVGHTSYPRIVSSSWSSTHPGDFGFARSGQRPWVGLKGIRGLHKVRRLLGVVLSVPRERQQISLRPALESTREHTTRCPRTCSAAVSRSVRSIVSTAAFVSYGSRAEARL